MPTPAGDRLLGRTYRPPGSDPCRIHPTTESDGAPPVLAEVVEAPAPACAQDNESDGATDEAQPTTAHAPSRRSLVLKGHTKAVRCLAALDGGRLASGSNDKSIIIWNLADDSELARLEGHTDSVTSLAALDGDRLASGGVDKSIIVWNLADCKQLAKLEGHTGYVLCLAALDGDRLASCSHDKSVIIWNLADGSQLAKLKGHMRSVSCLAALDGDRLASGGVDKSIIVWNLADGAQLAKLEGHTSSVTSLAALADGRLASGSFDKSIIIWNLADGTQLAKLEGHTNSVDCLAALAGGRLASSSFDESIIVWDLADGTQLFKLEGHTVEVICLAAFDDGNRLASSDRDGTIRVRPVLHSAAYKFAACSSAFEFEELARECHEDDRLGDLFDAAAVQQFDKDIQIVGAKLSLSDQITAQAHVFDAIAKNITSDDDSAVLVERLLDFVRDDNLLPTMKRQGASDAAIEKLAPTALFRVVIDGKYVSGPRLLLYVEFVSFLVVMFCFARVATFDVLGWSDPWLLTNKAFEKTVALVVAFAVLAYFSAREVGQIQAARAIELVSPESPFDDDPKGFAWLALALPRYGLLLVILVPLLLTALVCKVLVKLSLLEDGSPWTQVIDDLQNTRKYGFDGDVASPIFKAITHGPLTLLGLPRAWRGDYWNWIDAATLGCAWAAFCRAATPGRNLSTDHAAVTAMLLWLRLFGFLKNINQSLATFVLMFERIVRDLRVFMVFFLMIILAFGSALYLYLGQHEAEYYGFHDDGAPNAFESVRMTIFSLLLLGFIGDYDLDNYPNPADRTYLVLFLVVVVIVQLNILIAIVSDSYDAAMAMSEGLYYRSHLELVSETAWAAKLFPRRLLPRIDEAWIEERLAAALKDADDGEDQGRINYTSQRTRAMVQADTRRAIADLEERMVERMDAKFDEVLQLLRARPT